MKLLPILLILFVLAIVLFVAYFDTFARTNGSALKESITSASIELPIPEPNMSYEPHVGQPGMINERKYDTYPAPLPGQILTPLPVHQLRVNAIRGITQ